MASAPASARTLEQAVTFDCVGHRLQGIVTLPEATQKNGGHAALLGMVIVVGGPQYRAGSHRQFVHLARLAAAAGLPTLRFDCRGMGDSEGEPRTFEEMDDDIASAIQALMNAAPDVQGVVLCALCDGASATLQYLRRRGPDARVQGLLLMNPWVRTDVGQAETRVRHYYRDRLLSAEFWRKLLSGQVARGALREALAAVGKVWSGHRRASPAGDGPQHFIDRMVEGWLGFTRPTLIVTSGRDYTAREFMLACGRDARWQQVMSRPNTRHIELAEADHTFSDLAVERELHRHCHEWLAQRMVPPGS